jgi:hypothetical protein
MTLDAAIASLLSLSSDDWDAEFIRPSQSAIDRARALLPTGADVTCSTRGDGGLRVRIHGTMWDALRLIVPPDCGGPAMLYHRTRGRWAAELATAEGVAQRIAVLTA